MKSAMQKLKEAVADQINFNGAALDAEPVMVIKGNTEFELVWKDEDKDKWVRLTFADLQEVVNNA